VIDFQTALSTEFLHIPVEMAACAFSAEKGELSSFHKYIDPGHIPKCHLASVVYRKDIHGMPFVKFEHTEKNYKTLWKDLCSFFDYNETSTKPQPSLFGTSCFMQTACLKWIAKKAGADENIFGPVRPIEDLITHVLKLTGHQESVKSANIQNYFYPVINNEVKLFKCKHHGKLENERAEELKQKGVQLQCALAHVRYLSHLLHQVMSRELKKAKQRSAERTANPDR